ncbi:YhgE/Pip domain-containing protein [Actinocorallia longicatena]|uniref:YhgE/Pip domain-containing protein n=1 Tax=Actinocorallia longicatena TaxID=111803 RepID=A0ABP6PYZ5_9ACTN
MIRALRLARYELKRFRTPLQRAGLVFLASVPLMYGAVYLWSNWDPYGRLDRVPVAVVNEDQTVTAAGEEVHAGSDFVAELKKNPLLGWRFVGAERAEEGLAEGDYYAVITVPRDFSSLLSSGASGSPEQAAMQIRIDDGNNFLVGIMAETIQSELTRQIAAAADKAYFTAAIGRLGELRSGLTEASDGAGRLQDGAAELRDGADRLTGGIGTLGAGEARLQTGVGTLRDGTRRLVGGGDQVSAGVSKIAQIEVPLARRLSAALPGLAGKAVSVTTTAGRLSELTAAGTTTFAEYCDQVTAWLRTLPAEIRSDPLYRDLLRAAERREGRLVLRLDLLAAEHPALRNLAAYPWVHRAAELADLTLTGLLKRLPDTVRTDPVYRDLLALAERLDRDANKIADLAVRVDGKVTEVAVEARALRREVPALRRRLNTAAGQLTELDQGARALATGIRAADRGTAALQQGVGELRRGTGALADGSGRLSQGAGRLEAGGGELADRLGSAADEIPSYGTADAAVLADPVKISTVNAHPATFYGRGLAPFFFAIALWVFGIVAFLLLKPVSGRILASRLPSPTVALSAWFPVIAMGLAGAGLLFAAVDLLLGLDPVNLPGTLGLMALGIAAFSAIVHTIRLAFGAVGDAVALVLLMVQLVSCGGLYPVQTLPEPFQTVNAFIPMTYLVRALRVTISGGNPSITWQCAVVLFLFLCGALALLTLVVHHQRRWSMGRLKPELEL